MGKWAGGPGWLCVCLWLGAWWRDEVGGEPVLWGRGAGSGLIALVLPTVGMERGT
ncbi:hypothetical protein GCM10018785_23090 [Streptomyces longispororuber]|uniref:Uncharacterized protein n=1 Tax=Streptomyces longispororuber TaxID=68230 RepID=A0A919DK28_9ACTN|nr:hypothetical protein GCM10018785_23090 [Streptomyces longispororuber]